MDGLYITALTGIDLSEPLERGFRFQETFFLTNDPNVVADLVTPLLRQYLGPMETAHLLNASAVVYSELPFEASIADHKQALQVLNSQLRITQAFVASLWFLKDNAVNFELGFLQHPKRESAPVLSVSSNAIAVRVSTSDGLYSRASFSKDDLRAARDVFDQFQTLTDDEAARLPVDSIRFERAMHFVFAARAASTLGVKVANYVTALEALFATDTQELSHRLSERVALFLGESPEDRRSIFDAVKKSYKIRSRIVHGDRLSRKEEAVVAQVATGIDALARRCLLRICSDPELFDWVNGSAERIDEYFLVKLFGSGAS